MTNATSNHTTHRERLLRRPEVEKLTGRCRSAIYAGIADGSFPKPVKIGARAVAWPESSVLRWISERIEEGAK